MRNFLRHNLNLVVNVILGVSAGLAISIVSLHCQDAQRQKEADALRKYEQVNVVVAPDETQDVTVAEPTPAQETVQKAEPTDVIDVDYELLCCCVEAEAGNQTSYARRLVTDVVLNRVLDADFPDTIAEVIKAPGAFTVVKNRAIDRVKPSDSTKQIVAEELQNGRANAQVLFFTSEGWGKYGTKWQKIDDLYFCTK